jgi:hypothetical protein
MCGRGGKVIKEETEENKINNEREIPRRKDCREMRVCEEEEEVETNEESRQSRKGGRK